MSGGFWSWLTGDSWQQGNDAQYEWSKDFDGVRSSDVPDSAIKHMARQGGYDEDEYLDGWRDGDKEQEQCDKVVGWFSRLFGG